MLKIKISWEKKPKLEISPIVKESIISVQKAMGTDKYSDYYCSDTTYGRISAGDTNFSTDILWTVEHFNKTSFEIILWENAAINRRHICNKLEEKLLKKFVKHTKALSKLVSNYCQS
jgi:hypothetical protein